MTTDDVPAFPERARESALRELIDVDPAVAVLCVEEGLASPPEEIELPTDEPVESPVDDEPDPIGPVSVDELPEPLLNEEPPVDEPPPMLEPPVEPPLPVESWAHADEGAMAVALISSVRAPNAVESFMVITAYPVHLLGRMQYRSRQRERHRISVACEWPGAKSIKATPESHR